MARPKGWRKQHGRHAAAAKKGWRNRAFRKNHPTFQTGSSNTEKDRQRPAKKPGFRKSRRGKGYSEYRRNRSDVSRTKRL